MSCNPAIGGLAKGQLVREVTRSAASWRARRRRGINSRCSTIPRAAVCGPRAQCDKRCIALAAKSCEHWGPHAPRGMAEDFLDAHGRIPASSARTARRSSPVASSSPPNLLADSCTRESAHGGRAGGEPAAVGLSAASRGSESHREFKTGTPPRLDRSSIDYGSALLSGAMIARSLFLRTAAAAAVPSGALLAHETNEAAHA